MCIQRITPALVALLAAATVAGCGAQNNRDSYRSSSGTASTVSLSTSTVGDWVCPSSNYNIVPVAGSITQSMSLRVCRSSTQSGRFLIEGHSDSSEICVFPSSRTSSGALSVRETPKCYNLATGPIVADFTASGINYMLVTARANSTALAACMTSTSACPAYAAGVVP